MTTSTPDLRILLIDRDPTDAQIVQGLLRESGATGFAVWWEPSPARANELLNAERFDACLVDQESAASEMIRNARGSTRTQFLILAGASMERAKRGSSETHLRKSQLTGRSLARSIRRAVVDATG